MPKLLKHLSSEFKSGDRVFVSSMSTESALLAEALRENPEHANGVNFIAIQFPGIDSTDYLSLHPESQLTSFFMSKAVRQGLQENRAKLHALDYLTIAHHLKSSPPPDIAIAQVSLPDSNGRYSFGLSHDFLPLVWKKAKRRIVHINPLMPYTKSSFYTDRSEIDCWIDAERPLLQYKEPVPGDIDLRIAGYASSLVRDGDTLQFGIGTVPLALGQALSGHKKLKIHAGMVTPIVRRLIESGAIDPHASITSGVALGDNDFYRIVAKNPQFWFTDVEHTHSIQAIAKIPRFIAVNSAVEVDLFGQVNSERIGGSLQAGSGGLPAFAQGALHSEGGRLLICLRSTAAGGKVSRVVPTLDTGGLCTLPGYMADAVITEYGIAELRGRSLEERAQALISVAAPEFRSKLQSDWDNIRIKL
jgi:acyl-CoA hydrolase